MIRKEFLDDWKSVDGKWILTRHAFDRFTERFGLSRKEINEILENLDREIIVRVPNFNEKENSYTVQTLLQNKSINIIAEKNTKKIITVLSPFLFSGQLSEDRMIELEYDTIWNSDGVTTSELKDIIDQNEKVSGKDADLLSELEVAQEALAIANKRIIELERAIKSIRSLNSTLIDNALKIKDSCNAIL